jgi:hypothetical protein
MHPAPRYTAEAERALRHALAKQRKSLAEELDRATHPCFDQRPFAACDAKMLKWAQADVVPSEGRGHKFESCRARQGINGLAGLAADRAAPSYPVATKFEKKASSDRFMHVPPVGGATAF